MARTKDEIENGMNSIWETEMCDTDSINEPTECNLFLFLFSFKYSLFELTHTLATTNNYF